MYSVYLSIISAIFLFVLGLYFLANRSRRNISNILFSLLCFILGGLEITDRLTVVYGVKYRYYSMLLEALLPFSFLALSIFHSRKRPFNISIVAKVALLLSLVFPISVVVFKNSEFYFAPDIQTEGMVFLGNLGYVFYLGIMLYCVLSLINLEATFSSSKGSERWRLKFTFMGLICLIAMEIFYTSQALLYRTLNLNLLPARSLVFILGSVLIAYSKIFRGNNVNIAVSRFMLYRSLGLLSVGLYLIVLGLLGEGLRYTGINYSENLLLVFGFLCGVAVFTVVFSEQVRRKIKVFINKHFYAHKHDYRQQWLGFTERLSKCRDINEIEKAVLETYRDTFGFKWIALFMFDKNTKSYRYKKGLPELDIKNELAGDAGLIRYFREKKRIFNPDTPEYKPEGKDQEFVKSTRPFLIIPLLGTDSVEGFLVCGDQLVREELIYEDYDLMKTLAKQATLAIVNQRLAEELIETRQIAAVAKVASFVIHDLKNMVSTLSMTVENAQEYMDDRNFQEDMLKTLKGTVRKMTGLIEKLKNFPEKQNMSKVNTDINLVVEDVVSSFSRLNGRLRFVKCSDVLTVNIDVEEIKKVLTNLVINAIEATEYNKGEIVIETGRSDNGRVVVKVSDNGIGMNQDYIREHLFKPFKTTKKEGLGIGLYQCKQIIEAHGGKIEVSSSPDKGTDFRIYL